MIRAVALTAVYLLVLTSLHPGDVVLVAAGRRIRPLGPPYAQPVARRLAGVPALVLGPLVGNAMSTWRTALWCVQPRRTPPGLVAVPHPRVR